MMRHKVPNIPNKNHLPKVGDVYKYVSNLDAWTLFAGASKFLSLGDDVFRTGIQVSRFSRYPGIQVPKCPADYRLCPQCVSSVSSAFSLYQR